MSESTNMHAHATADPKQARAARRRRITRTILGRGGIYLFLSLLAALMIFPFVYMAASALKTPADTFRYPPKVLPREPVVLEVNGEDLPVYSLPVDGADRDVVLAESGVPAGVFVDPANPEEEVAWPIDLVTDTGRTATLEGEEVGVYEVPVDGETTELALKRSTVVGRFADPDDPSVETYAVVRTAPAAEQISARTENFSEVLERRSLDRALTNTILVTVLVVAGILFTSIMGGYAFARLSFPGRNAIFLAYLGSIMIPFIVVIVPLFQLMVALDWIDHLGVLVWPFLFNAYGTFLMRQFFVSIPKDLEEAALIDGAKRWRILWTIFVPLSWPAIATLATFSFLYAWNSFVWPFVAINTANESDWVLTIALQQLGGQSVESPNLIFAGIVIAVVLPMLVFIMAQRYFVENVATSGIK
jgi:multiple sugar transport system permease protein